MRPLDGIRVLDLSRLVPGPFASLILRDLGAEVDKLEDPAQGDYLRHVPPQCGGTSAAFHALNRGKRSIVLDLKSEAGRSAFERLLSHYDVLLEQFRPGVLGRLGLGHDALLAAHPRLIICALTGYGQTGPLRQRAGHDLNYLARAGLLGFQGPASAPPQVPAFQLADISGALWAVIGILAALREREQQGRGRLVDVAMTDGLFGFAALSYSAALNGVTTSRGHDLLTGGIAPYRTYLSEDGWPIALAALEPKFWLAFCAATGLDGDLSALVPGPHQQHWIATVTEIFSARSRQQWAEFAAEHDCCVEVAVEPDRLGEDPQLAERGLLFEVPTSSDSAVRCFRTPLATEDTPAAPAPGQHTRPILRDAGLTDQEIDELMRAGVALDASSSSKRAGG